MRLISRTLDQIPSPISSADDLLRQYQGGRPVLDCSQGAPAYPTAPEIAARIASVAASPDGGKYTTRPGLYRLRELLAAEISEAYCGTVNPEQVLITAGCNEAFCVTVSTLADHGDSIILTVPYYFNHDMWLRLDRMSPIYLPCTSQCLPDPAVAAGLITESTRAIVS